MVEEQKKRAEDQMASLIEEIDKSHLRTLQGDMHRCAATCCDNQSYSMQKTQMCIENCAAPLQKAQVYIQQELERVQNRLQRCIMDCNDKIKDKMGPDPSESVISKSIDEFERCATKCVDNYCDMLPAMEKAIKQVLASKKLK